MAFTVPQTSHAPRPVDLSDILRGARQLAADFDGSIVKDHEKDYMSSPLVVKAAELAALINQRYNLATVTGGRISRAKDWADASRTLLFAENGGVLYNPIDFSRRYEILVDEDEARFITHTVAPMLEKFLNSTFPGYEKSEGKHTMATYHKPQAVPIEEFKTAAFAFLESLSPEITSRLFYTHSHTLIDINHKGATKARAIRHIAGVTGVRPSKFVFYGDGSNDVPAFDAVLIANGKVIIPSNRDNVVKSWELKRSEDKRVFIHPFSATECYIDILDGLKRGSN